MALLKDRDRNVLRKEFASLMSPVRLLVFVDSRDCRYCSETRQLAEELGELSDKITVEVTDRLASPEVAARYGIPMAPAIAILQGDGDGNDTRIRFFGIPSGYEISTLVDDITAVSRGEASLSGATVEWLETLDQPLHLQVFVTPTCPYCPRAVSLAHRLALASPLIRADMIEAMEFPKLADQYHVYGVPRTVINETIAVEGAVPEGRLLEHLKEAVASAA